MGRVSPPTGTQFNQWLIEGCRERTRKFSTLEIFFFFQTMWNAGAGLEQTFPQQLNAFFSDWIINLTHSRHICSIQLLRNLQSCWKFHAHILSCDFTKAFSFFLSYFLDKIYNDTLVFDFCLARHSFGGKHADQWPCPGSWQNHFFNPAGQLWLLGDPGTSTAEALSQQHRTRPGQRRKSGPLFLWEQFRGKSHENRTYKHTNMFLMIFFPLLY